MSHHTLRIMPYHTTPHSAVPYHILPYHTKPHRHLFSACWVDRYSTGDHASVLPSNNPVLVERTLKRIGAKYSQWFTVTGNGRWVQGLPRVERGMVLVDLG